MTNAEKTDEVVRTNFDHSYDPDPSKGKSKIQTERYESRFFFFQASTHLYYSIFLLRIKYDSCSTVAA